MPREMVLGAYVATGYQRPCPRLGCGGTMRVCVCHLNWLCERCFRRLRSTEAERAAMDDAHG